MATYTWQNGVSADWYSPEWGHIGEFYGTPGAGDVANITVAPSNSAYTVTAKDEEVTTTNHSEFFFNSWEAGSVVLGSAATLEIDSDFFYIDSSVTSTGHIKVDTTLTIGPSSGAANQTVNLYNGSGGTGVVTLSDSGPSSIVGQASTDSLVNQGETINGGGTISNLTFANFSGIVNASSSIAQLVINNIGVMANYGILEATGSQGLSIGGVIDQQKTSGHAGPGIIQAVGANARVYLRDGTQIVGGTIRSSGGGIVQTSSGAVLLDGSSASGVTGVVNAGSLEVVDDSVLTVKGNLSNSGTITVDSPDLGDNLRIDEDGAFLSGAGSINIAAGASLLGNSSSVSAVLQNSSNIVGAGALGDGDGSLTIVNRGAGIINSTAGLIVDTDVQTLQNSGLIEATTGVLTVRSQVVSQSAGTIEANGANVVLSGVTVQGGTIASKSVMSAIQTSGAVTYDGSASQIQHTGYTEILDGSSLTLKGQIALSGGITLDVPNIGTSLLIDASNVTLTGKGSIYTRGGTIDHSAASTSSTLTNVDNMIFGEGSIGSDDGKLHLINEFRVEAVDDLNGDNGGLTLNTGDTIINAGYLQSGSATGLTIANSTVENVSSYGTGLIEAFAGCLVTLQSATIAGGSLIGDTLGSSTGAFRVSDAGSVLDGSGSSVTIKALINVADGTAITLMGSIVNDGTIALSGSNIGATIKAGAGGATLSGMGVIMATGGADLISGTTLTNVNDTIEGSFQIGDGSGGLTFINQASGTLNASDAAPMSIATVQTALSNAGLIESTGVGGLTVNSSTVTDASTAHIDLGGTGGSFFLSSTIDDTAGSRIDVRTGTSLTLQASTIKGGILAVAGTGMVTVSNGTSVLDGSSAAVTLSGTVTIVDGAGLTLNGVSASGTALTMSGSNIGATLTVAGSGATLSASTLSMSGGANAILGTTGSSLTLAGSTLSGGGSIGDGSPGVKLIVNADSVVNASDAQTQLLIETFSALAVNKGLIEATGAAGLQIDNSSLDQTGGGTIEAAAGSQVELASALILGGTLTASGTGSIRVTDTGSVLSGSDTAALTLNGTFAIDEGTAVTLIGTVSNKGSFVVSGNNFGAHLTSDGETFTGGGSVILTGGAASIIGLSGSTLDNVDNTISGYGQIGSAMSSLTNETAGVVKASGGLLELNIDSGKLTNKGLLLGASGGNLAIESATVNTGTIKADGGTVTITGAVTGSGSAGVDNGGTLDVETAFGQSITFGAAGGTLVLKQSVAAIVSGYALGDKIDVRSVAFSSPIGPSVSSVLANGVGSITVKGSGSTATVKVSSLPGTVLFGLSDDGNGGTSVTALGAGVNTGTVALGGGFIQGGISFQNKGTVTATGSLAVGDSSSSAAQVINATGAVFNLSGDVGITVGSGTSSSVTNSGKFAKTAGAGVSHVAAAFTDTGTVAVASGSLEFDGPSNSFAGAFTGAGKAIFGGGTDAFNAGFSIGTSGWTVTGAGTTATLNVAQNYGGAFALSGGATLTLAKALTLSGGASFVSSKVSGTSTLSTSAATTVNGATLAGTVAWINTGTVTASGALTLGDAGQKVSFTNAGGATYNITGTGGLVLGGATTSVFNNAGLLERSGINVTAKIGVRVMSTGTVTVATGGLEFDASGTTFAGAITGAGTVSFGNSVGATLLAGSSLSVATVSVLSTGRLNIGANLSYGGKLLEAAGGVLSLGTSTLSLTGTATIDGTVSGAGGTLAVTGGNLGLNGSAALSMSGFALSNGATITTYKALATQATFTESVSTLVLNQHILTLAQGASFNAGTIDGAGGGAVTVKGSGTLAGGLTIDGKATLTLYGVTNETGGLTLGDSSGGMATLFNAAGATFTIGDDSAIQAPAGGTGKVSNAGTLIKSGSSGTSLIAPAVTNTGTIAVASGTLNLAGGVLGTGKLTIGSGATLEFGGPTSAGSTVTFASNGNGEILQLDTAQTFAGKVAGFGAGDTLDLANESFAGAALSYADTTSGGVHSGTLTVKSGGITTNLHLLGSYTLRNFTPAAPDSNATPGTLITFHT